MASVFKVGAGVVGLNDGLGVGRLVDGLAVGGLVSPDSDGLKVGAMVGE